MVHPKKAGGAPCKDGAEEAWASTSAMRDWEADTDVMPPEYCRQLLEISRQLERGK